jgi:integrase
MPPVPFALLGPTAHQGAEVRKTRCPKEGGQMTDLNLAEYNNAHRTRERRENGSVKLVGAREKKWEGSYHVYLDGKRSMRRRIIGTKAEIPTKTAAQELHRTWLRRQASQSVATTSGASVAALCDDYLTLKKGDWEVFTHRTMCSIFNSIIKPAIGARPIDKVTPDELKHFISALPDRKYTTPGGWKRVDRKLVKVPGKVKTGISAQYVQKIVTHLRAVFDLAAERDLIAKNPTRSIMVRLRTPKQARKTTKEVFAPQYLKPLLEQLKARDALIVWISILGATRPNELFAIRGADVGPTWIRIQRALDRWRNVKETKTGKGRVIHLPPLVAEELRDWMRHAKVGPTDLVFQNKDGGAVDRKNFLNRKLRPAAVRAGIPVTNVDFRMLRRSFATLALMIGFDVKSIQSQLGHARPDMTLTEYSQAVDAHTAEHMVKLEEILRGSAPLSIDASAKLGGGLIQ